MQSEYLFELGGENKELAKAEALELLKTENYRPKKGFEEENHKNSSLFHPVHEKTVTCLGCRF